MEHNAPAPTPATDGTHAQGALRGLSMPSAIQGAHKLSLTSELGPPNLNRMIHAESTVEALSLPQQRYVEIIDGLMRESGQIRVTDVAARMEVSLPSASEAVKRLVELGIAMRIPPLGVALTVEGRRIANQLDRRHQALKRFMVDVMAMEPERADIVACRVEHCVDGEFSERLLDLAQFLEREYPWTLRGIAEHVRDRQSKLPESVDLLSGI